MTYTCKNSKEKRPQTIKLLTHSSHKYASTPEKSYSKNSQSRSLGVAAVVVVKLDGAGAESNVSHFVVTTTGAAAVSGCGTPRWWWRLGVEFLILSKSSVSTYFCTLLT